MKKKIIASQLSSKVGTYKCKMACWEIISRYEVILYAGTNKHLAKWANRK